MSKREMEMLLKTEEKMRAYRDRIYSAYLGVQCKVSLEYSKKLKSCLDAIDDFLDTAENGRKRAENENDD